MMKNCQGCGNQFRVKPSKSAAKFCGQSCYGLSKRGLKPWNFGIKTGVTPWLGKKRSAACIEKIRASKLTSQYRHSPEVRARIREGLFGKPKGGVSKIAAIIRGMSEYKKWRKAVFERDDFSCQDCGARGGYLNADHNVETFASILKRHDIKTTIEAAACDALWDIDNGRTVCLECHKLTPTFGNRRPQHSDAGGGQ